MQQNNGAIRCESLIKETDSLTRCLKQFCFTATVRGGNFISFTSSYEQLKE